VKFPAAIHQMPLSEADRVIVTLHRIEIAGYVCFVREGEKPRIRVKMGRG